MPLANTAELVVAVNKAETAQRVGPPSTPQRWGRVLMRFHDLANRNMDRSARLLASDTFGGWKRSGFSDLNEHGPD